MNLIALKVTNPCDDTLPWTLLIVAPWFNWILWPWWRQISTTDFILWLPEPWDVNYNVDARGVNDSSVKWCCGVGWEMNTRGLNDNVKQMDWGERVCIQCLQKQQNFKENAAVSHFDIWRRNYYSGCHCYTPTLKCQDHKHTFYLFIEEQTVKFKLTISGFLCKPELPHFPTV